MLTQRHRIAIRRHLGVPFANTAVSGRLFGWRFAIHVEDLEYKMSNLAPSEEQLITGLSMGSWQIGGIPQLGDVLQFTINDGVNTIPTVTYTVTAQDINPQPNLINPTFAGPTYSIALNVAQKINQVAQQFGYGAVGAPAADMFNVQYLPPQFAEVILTTPYVSGTVTLSAAVTGATNNLVSQQVAPCPVQAVLANTATKTTNTYYGYVAILDALAMGMTQQNLSLWLSKADVVTFRPDELVARRRLYRQYCEMLSRDMGGQEYVDYFFGGGGNGVYA